MPSRDHSKTSPSPAHRPEPRRSGARQALGDATNQWLARNRSLVLRQTPFWAQSVAGIVIVLGTISVLGGVLFKIDEVVTVQGQLVSSAGNRDVKTPAGGKVAEVLFRDGQYVQRGQLLLRFDTRQAADERSTLGNLIELEQRDLRDRLAILRSRETVLRQKVKTQEGIVEELKALVSIGGFQRVQYLQQLDTLLQLQSDLSSIKLDQSRTRLEAEKSIGQMRNRLRQAELQLQYQNVLAPINGVVFEPKARPDGVLAAGETILTLVPQDGLQALVYVPNKDIGFVKKGQKAQVRVDAFPFTRYGELKGTVMQIGADALPPDERFNFFRFPVRLKLNRPFLESQDTKIPLQSGMAVTTNLKLREKRVITLVSDLLVNQAESVRSLRQQ